MSLDSPVRDLDELASLRLLHQLRSLRRQMAPVMLSLALVVVVVDPDAWRHALTLVALGTVMFAILHGRRTDTPRSVRTTLWASGLAQLAFVFELGGIASPTVPALVIFALVVNVVAPARVGVLMVLTVQIPAVWLFAWVHHARVLPEIFPSVWRGLFADPGAAGPGPYVGAAFLSAMLATTIVAGRAIRRALLDLARERLAQAQVELEVHAEATRTLTRLSAEIAHELKNPLASIKGLAALVHRDLSGKTAERMEVLRREVDRMQGILDELLNHSRPLVPLEPEDVDLARVVDDVLALHEATAARDEVRLERVGVSTLPLRCDPRKVRQVLLNLVQNALDASPPRTTIGVALTSDHDLVRIDVDDEGEGLGALDPARVFDVGFTTKETGSGLGLALARGLVRQHGGELTLARRDPHGCRASFTLSRALPRTEIARTEGGPSANRARDTNDADEAIEGPT